MLTKLVLKNFRRFKTLNFSFDPELNVLVGNNDTGKSTILQALEMVLTGRIAGRPIESELTPYWFPSEVTKAFLAQLQSNQATKLPDLSIEAYFQDHESLAQHKGKNNSCAEDTPGIRLTISFDPSFDEEYQAITQAPSTLHSIPVEFYKIERRDFSGQTLGNRPPVTVAAIDSSTLRLQSGTDHYLKQAIEKYLPSESRAKLSLAFRTHREELARDPAFVSTNECGAPRLLSV